VQEGTGDGGECRARVSAEFRYGGGFGTRGANVRHVRVDSEEGDINVHNRPNVLAVCLYA